MKTDHYTQSANAVFLQMVSVALAQLKQRLQHDYERAYPGLREIIHLVLDQEEANAWELSSFPHLVLPDLVEAHIANLNLQPTHANHSRAFAKGQFEATQSYEPAVALCSY
jgi:hypothetical protein